MRQQGLTRYDANSLRPISRMENLSSSVIPRISIPGDPYLHELTVMSHRSPALSPAIHSAALSPALQPSASVALAAPPAINSEPQGQVHRGLLANPEPEDDWTEILHNIPEIGISRFLYLLKKYPAIVLVVIGAWILWGRGWSTTTLQTIEKNLGITGVVAGGVTAAGVIFTSQHHSNDKNAAKSQTVIRMIVSGINVVLSIVVVIFGTITISDIHSETESITPESPALTLNERTAHAGTMIGIGLLTGIFALMSFLFGWQGFSKVTTHEKRTKEISRRRQAAAYANPGMIDTY